MVKISVDVTHNIFGAKDGLCMHAYLNSDVATAYVTAMVSSSGPTQLEVPCPSTPLWEALVLQFFANVRNALGEPGKNYAGRAIIIRQDAHVMKNGGVGTHTMVCDAPIKSYEDNDHMVGTVVVTCVMGTISSHAILWSQARAPPVICGGRLSYSKRQEELYRRILDRSLNWHNSIGLIPIKPSVHDIYLPYLNSSRTGVPGYAFALLEPRARTPVNIFRNLLLTAAFRRGISQTNTEAMCKNLKSSDPATVGDLAVIVAEALQVGPNFYTYMRDFNDRNKKGGPRTQKNLVGIERFSGAIRAVHSGDCEDLGQEIGYLCDEWRQQVHSDDVCVRAGAVVLNNYVGLLTFGAAKTGRPILFGTDDDGLDGHAFFILLPVYMLNMTMTSSYGPHRIRVRHQQGVPPLCTNGLPAMVIDGTNLNTASGDVMRTDAMSTLDLTGDKKTHRRRLNHMTTSVQKYALLRDLAETGDPALAALRLIRGTVETDSFYELAVVALCRDSRVVHAMSGQRVYEVYFVTPPTEADRRDTYPKYGITLQDLNGLAQGSGADLQYEIRATDVPTDEEVDAMRAGLTICHPVPALKQGNSTGWKKVEGDLRVILEPLGVSVTAFATPPHEAVPSKTNGEAIPDALQAMRRLEPADTLHVFQSDQNMLDDKIRATVCNCVKALVKRRVVICGEGCAHGATGVHIAIQ